MIQRIVSMQVTLLVSGETTEDAKAILRGFIGSQLSPVFKTASGEIHTLRVHDVGKQPMHKYHVVIADQEELPVSRPYFGDVGVLLAIRDVRDGVYSMYQPSNVSFAVKVDGCPIEMPTMPDQCPLEALGLQEGTVTNGLVVTSGLAKPVSRPRTKKKACSS